MPTERFVVLTQARTGSEYLCTLLNSHPDIACHRELFNPRHIVHVLPRTHVPDWCNLSQRDLDPVGFLQQIVQATAAAYPTKPAVGFKLFFEQSQPVLDHVMQNRDWAIVALERRNKLAQYTSLMIARETARWNSFRNQPAMQHRVVVDLGQFARFLRKQSVLSNSIGRDLQSRGSYLRIDSEAIDDRIAEVLTFLGVTNTARIRSARTRQNDNRMKERIINWDEVASYLERADLQSWASNEDEVGSGD